MKKPEITQELVAKENWKAFESFAKSHVTCINDHEFYSHAKFSGYLIAIVSKDPCPVCGSQELRSAHSGWEAQNLTGKDRGTT